MYNNVILCHYMTKKEDDCLKGCIEHRQFLSKDSAQIVDDFKRDWKFQHGYSISKSQAVNKIILQMKVK